MPADYLPILILIVVSVMFAIIALVVPYFLGPRNPTPVKEDTYESGKLPYGDARRQVPVQYYLVAMLFLLFDLEVIFFYPWAVIFKRLGVYGLATMGVFFLLLIVGLIYEWKKGALEWN